MAVTQTTQYNGKKIQVSGTFTGSEDTEYRVEIFDDSGTKKFKWQKKLNGSATYTTLSALTTITPNALNSLDEGVKIKFTNTNIANYNTSDVWTFTAFTAFKMNAESSASSNYDFIETIDRGTDTDLIVFSKDSGNIAVLESIDSDSPTFSGVIGSIPPFEDISMTKRNRELYVSTSNTNTPKWVGYSSDNGFDIDVEDEVLLQEEALNQFESSDQPESITLDKFVILKGGDAILGSKHAKLSVGINTEGDKKRSILYVYNIDDGKLFEYPTESQPIAIRRWSKITSGSQKNIEGVIVLCEKQNDECINALEFWEIPSVTAGFVGQTSIKRKTLHFQKPLELADGQDITSFFDFLHVPNTATIDTCDNTLVFACNVGNLTSYNPVQAHDYQWLWKIDSSDFNWENVASSGIITEDKYVSMTPKIDFTSTSGAPDGGWVYMMENLYAESDSQTGNGPWTKRKVVTAGRSETIPHQRIVDFPKYHSLEFGGWDGNGGNPVIMWTVRFKRPSVSELSYGDFVTYDSSPPNYFSGGSTPAYYRPKEASRAIYEEIYDSGERSLLNFGFTAPDGYNTGNTINASYWYDKQPILGPLLSDGAGNDQEKTYRAVEWGTYVIPTSTSGSGNTAKIFIHFVDWATSASFTNMMANRLGLELPFWAITTESDAINRATESKSPTLNQLVPAQSPLFGSSGRFHVWGHNQANSPRAGLEYYHPGFTSLMQFRWGSGDSNSYTSGNTNIGSPTNPGIFPNILPSVYEKFNTARGLFVNSAPDPADGAQKANKIVAPNVYVSALSPDLINKNSNNDKLRWKMGEGPRHYFPHLTTGSSPTTKWYPMGVGGQTATKIESRYMNAIPLGQRTSRKAIRLDNGTSVDGTDVDQLISTTNALVTITLASTQPSATNASWAGVSAKKLFYKVAFIYDGYQETPLLFATGTYVMSSDVDIDHQVDVQINISEDYHLNKRITGIALYRASSGSQSDTEPETLYRFIEELKLTQFTFLSTNYWSSFQRDTGDAEATYEALNNISEKSYSLTLKYKISTEQNGYLFATDAKHQEIKNSHNYIFRSQIGKFSIFDWTRDFVALPFVPTTIKGFMGKVYAFSKNQMCIINAESLFIEDTIDGIGCLDMHSIKTTDTGLFWCDLKNIYMASPQVVPVGDIIKDVKVYGWDKISVAGKKTVRLGYDGLRKAYLIFFTENGVHRCWAFSTMRSRWDLWDTTALVKDTVDLESGHCLLLLEDNQICKYLGNTTFKRSFEWESKKLTFGNDLQEKRIRNVKIATDSRANTTLQYKVIDDESAYANGTDISDSFPGSHSGYDTKNKAIKLASSDGSKHYWIKYKVTGDNSAENSNRKIFAISTIYKSKRYK